MLGSSNTALLTLSGGTRPKCVYYMGVEMRCTEYRPTIQMCLECMQEGHCSDVCPNPKNICRGCGLENPPPQGHECEVKCAVCRAAGHETRRCPNKLIAAKRGKTTPSLDRGSGRDRTRKGTGALVRVDGGGGPLLTPIEIQIAPRKQSEEQYPLEGPLQLQGFAAVEFATAQKTAGELGEGCFSHCSKTKCW
ncbi:hypothetical protein HPB49_021625 [Dermacentor silvarum]|uniref:Uncharacterized protein n=1 Tax=Dermacentor silvarum TaxID=543639 RepID=A0ACB8DGB3_DERSI|nr:hypothetical protein HPB49_021625 [Dermacentor silvarum]